MSDVTPGNTLLSRSKELSDKMKRIANRDADEMIVRRMEEIQAPLSRHVSTAAGLLNSLSVMRKTKIVKSNPMSDVAVKPLQDGISKLRKRLRDNRTQLMTGNVWAECDTHAKSRTRELEQQLQQQWKAFVIDNTPGIAPFRPFAKLTACKPKFDKLEELEREARVTESRLPSSESEIEAVRTRGERMRQLIDGLGLEGEPTEMQDILKRCAQSGVPLDELKDEVLTWLKGKGFAASLRIVTR